jgi:hypothetical protein
MRTRIAVVLAVLVVVGGLVALRRYRMRTGGEAGHAESAQGTGVDFRLSPMLAGFDAPDGGTACETSYNAYAAIDEAAKKTGMHVPWTTLPERSAFLARCAALPQQEQDCFQPRYAAHNHPVCDPILSKYEKHNPMWP